MDRPLDELLQLKVRPDTQDTLLPLLFNNYGASARKLDALGDTIIFSRQKRAPLRS